MNKKLLFILCLLIFVDAIGAGLIFPIMPELFFNTQYGLVKEDSFLSGNMLYGLSFGLFPLASFFGMPLLGSLSDQYGRKKIMILGLAGICISDLLSCLAILVRDPYIFLLSRLVMGFCSGTYVIANAVIADLSCGIKSKMNNFRWPILAFISGFVLGPIIGSSSTILVGLLSLTIPFAIALCLSLFNLIFMYISFNEIYSTNQKERKVFKELFRAINYIFINKSLNLLTISYSLFQFSIGLFIQSISLFLAYTFRYNISDIGIFFSVMCIGLALNVLVIQPLLSKYMKISKLIITSISIIAIMLIIQGVSVYIDAFISINVKPVIWISSLVLHIFMPFATTGYTSIYSECIVKKEQGKAMGVLGQIYSMMWFLSSFFIGYLALTYESIILISAGISALLAAFLLYVQFFK
ncbi:MULTISPECIES: MFS transporter [unclassified Francisella]|uniref:MFS transporter n=1 Tax=unclassified Francisella TaxID=2610885 RepID=UPI002E36DA5A|nr:MULTISPECIES: MFS transporter [unclassified Francisella]MED7818924.1 MFS transporter [Francisella sp. 19S2-4]MED7829761.1 MFS transporter [Francisella sp. 19S2-10]